MNKAIDVFLPDVREDVLRLAAKLGNEGPSAFMKILEDLETAVMENLVVMQCPFCNGAPILSTYSNAVAVECDECAGKGGLSTDSSDEIIGLFMNNRVVIDERFGDGGEWDPNADGGFPGEARRAFRVAIWAIAAWHAVGKWNRRA